MCVLSCVVISAKGSKYASFELDGRGRWGAGVVRGW